ncbi:MAG TPA: carboxypeptidase regulatory-like domain-containing protein, partial [Vicinamibacteria bacterium]|nr:carboxypeptidase regulatory-like domain-containing protein [Vicinamibacteria bacterium]
MRLRKAFHAFVVAVVSLIGVAPLAAQSVGASLRGTVTDSGGAALVGATVVVRNMDTGDSRQLLTDREGRYHAPVLPPGEYEVRVTMTGFQTVDRRGVRLAVGQDAIVDAALDIGKMAEELVVEAEVSRVNLASGAVSGLVGEREIRDLPLNGRSFQQLALLQPGVQAALAAGNDVIGGRTPKISINGARPEQNNFLLDGTDINNVYNKTPGSAAGVLLGVEAVREFQVLTNAYSAEFGRSAGGVITAVTRSGTNEYHGAVFEFHRNDAMDAR